MSSVPQIHTHFRDSVSDLQAVVAVMNQEVLLEPQLPLPTWAVDQRHSRWVFLIGLVCMMQKGFGAVEGYFHLSQEKKSVATSQQKQPLHQIIMAFPHLTGMLHCGCSTRYWLSPVGGLLELQLQARGCGLSTEKGGWVPSLKWRGISLLFLSCRVCMVSKSCTRSCEAKWPEKWPQSTTGQTYCACTSCVHFSKTVLQLHVADFSDWLGSQVLLSVNHQPRHETPARPRHPPSALTACSNRKPRGTYATKSEHPWALFAFHHLI